MAAQHNIYLFNNVAACKKLGAYLASIDGVKSLTVLGHAGEGTFMSQREQMKVIEAFAESVNGAIPIIAGITLESTEVEAEEAKRAVSAGASAGLLYLSFSRLAAFRLSERGTTG